MRPPEACPLLADVYQGAAVGALRTHCNYTIPATAWKWRRWKPGTGASVRFEFTSNEWMGFDWELHQGDGVNPPTQTHNGHTFNENLQVNVTLIAPHLYLRYQYVGPGAAGGARLGVYYQGDPVTP